MSSLGPVLMNLGMHELLFREFHAAWYRRLGMAAWGWMKPEEEAVTGGTVMVALGFVMVLVARDWTGMILSGFLMVVQVLLRRFVPKHLTGKLAIVTLFPIAAALLGWGVSRGR